VNASVTFDVTLNPSRSCHPPRLGMLATLLFGAFALLVWRTARVLLSGQKPRKRQSKCTVAVFLGSGTRLLLPFTVFDLYLLGGHTSEALSLLSSLDFEKYNRRLYLVCEGDTLSMQKARTFEQSKSANPTLNVGWVLHQRPGLTKPSVFDCCGAEGKKRPPIFTYDAIHLCRLFAVVAVLFEPFPCSFCRHFDSQRSWDLCYLLRCNLYL